jgi:LacI family transcriptional regulator
MSKKIRLIDVAQASKTSIKTVSRVINDDPRVSDYTRMQVQKKINELGYQVDVVARSLRTGVDNIIGVVVQKISDPFFAEVVEEIEIEANRRGYGVIVGSTHGELTRENELVQGFMQRKVIGMIVTPQDVDYSYLEKSSVPVVFIDREPNNLRADTVRVDDFEGGKIATEHLVKRNHTKIAFFGDKKKVKTTELRLNGFKSALETKKIPLNDKFLHLGLDNDEKAEVEMCAILSSENIPTAIFASKSELAIGIIRALHKHERTDIALISFDDFQLADTLNPAVSVLDHSSRALGRAAILKLLRKIDGLEPTFSEDLLPLSVIERGSGELRPKVKQS